MIPLFYCIESFSQGEGNTWIFGDSTGIKFINNIPSVISSSINSLDLSSSISDKQGDLLFYNGPIDASGMTGFYNSNVWDKNHQIMPNGDSLKTNSGISQGSIIIPFPSDTINYYIFNIGFVPAVGLKLYCSIVDMSLNGGSGDITQKNILLCDTNLVSLMCAVRHGNGRDWWLINHQYHTSRFIKYLIAPSGIAGPFYQSIGLTNNSTGQMIFSNAGDKLVFTDAFGKIELFDFDRCTGDISNVIHLGTPPYVNDNKFFGCSFSSNDFLLYTSTFNDFGNDTVFQFDLTSANIKASQTVLFVNDSSGYNFGLHLLGPDGKIYIANSDGYGNAFDSLNMYLTVINSPNNLGAACNIAPFSFYLNGRKCYYGLPNIPNYNLAAFIGSPCDTLTTVMDELKAEEYFIEYPNPASGSITFKYNFTAKNETTMCIFNNLGKTVKSVLLPGERNEIVLDVTDFSAGIYFYQIKNNNKTFTGKIAVIN